MYINQIHKYKTPFIIFLGCLFSILQSHAIKTLQKADILDLSNNAVLYMHQDPKGNMWIGTYDGLNLYNGKNTVVFRYEPDNKYSIDGNIIRKIIDADPDHIWVSTILGVNKLSLKERIVVESYPQYPETSLLAADSIGNTLLITIKDFISYYSPQSKSFQDIYTPEASLENIKELFVDKDNHFFLLTADGLLKQIELNTQTTPVTLTFSELALHTLKIEHAYYEDNKIYFIDTADVLYEYDCSLKEKIKVADISALKKKYKDISKVTCWHSDIYISFMNSGLVKLEKSSTQLYTAIDITAGIFCLHKDKRQDILWVGTDGQGVQMYYEKYEKFGSLLLTDLPFNAQKPVRAIYTDENNTLWFATKGDGIFSVEEYHKPEAQNINVTKVKNYTTADGLPNNQVFAFLRSKYRNVLWIGSEGPGLSYYSYDKQKIYTLSQEVSGNIQFVHSICEVNDSTLWLATTGHGLLEVTLREENDQLSVKDLKAYTFRKNERVCVDFHSMTYDGDSILYVGSRGGDGVVLFNVRNKTFNFQALNQIEKSAIGDVLSVYANQNNFFYFGASSGLTQMFLLPNGESLIKQFDRKNGIANDMIHGILEDETGCIWLSTNKGLTKFNPNNEFFHNYYSPDLKVTEFSDDAYWKCPHTGKLFFGGINGLVWVAPYEKSYEKYTPELYFWDLKMAGQKYSLSDFSKAITIPAKISDFSISFIASDYINGENYEYSYFLENYNSSWIELQKRNEIQFSNIPYGKYVLHVKYKNDVYDSDAKTYSLPIIVSPPWYLSRIAILVYILTAFLLIALTIYQIRKRILRRQDAVARRIQEEEKEKSYESKLHFFTNITHELCTPLTLINGVSENIKEYAQAEADNSLTNYVEVLQNNVKELDELIREILDFRKIEASDFLSQKIESVNITELAQSIYQSFSAIAEKDKIKFTLSVPADLYWDTDYSSLKKILSNLTSNAFKYTKEEGTINISMRIEENRLILKVYNTGLGIEKSKIQSIFDRYKVLEHMDENKYMQMTARTGLGLSICKSLAQSLQGDIEIKSKVNEYAELIVSLPNLATREEALAHTIGETLELETSSPQNIEKVPEVFSKPMILVVDDNKDIRWFIAESLSPAYEIKEARDGIEALRIVEKHTPSLIITDIIMPQMDGLEFIQLIKSDKFKKHIPLVIISAKITDREKAEGLDIGADAYITKPFSAMVLLSTVNRLLSNKKELKEYLHSPESAYEYTEGQLVHQDDKEFMDSVLVIIRENIEKENLRPEFIAEKLGLNTRNLYRRFKKISSLSPSDFIKDYRFIYAAQLLINTNLTIQEVIYKVGITNKSYFYREFMKKYQMTPKEYRSRK